MRKKHFNERGEMLIEIVVILSVIGLLLSLLFSQSAPLNTTEVAEISTTPQDSASSNKTNLEETSSTTDISLAKEIERKMSFNSTGPEQSMRLGRGYTYDLNRLRESIDTNISEFFYLEDNFHVDKQVYFSVGDKHYLYELK